MELRCVDCGQMEDGLAMERTAHGPRCALCQHLVEQEHDRTIRRRLVAVGGGVLGFVAVGTGAPVVLIGQWNTGPGAGRLQDASLLVWLVGALALAGALAGAFSLGRSLASSLGEEAPTSTLDRLLLPAGGLVALGLALVTLPLLVALWWGPDGTARTLDSAQALLGF